MSNPVEHISNNQIDVKTWTFVLALYSQYFVILVFALLRLFFSFSFSLLFIYYSVVGWLAWFGCCWFSFLFLFRFISFILPNQKKKKTLWKSISISVSLVLTFHFWLQCIRYNIKRDACMSIFTLRKQNTCNLWRLPPAPSHSINE